MKNTDAERLLAAYAQATPAQKARVLARMVWWIKTLFPGELQREQARRLGVKLYFDGPHTQN